MSSRLTQSRFLRAAGHTYQLPTAMVNTEETGGKWRIDPSGLSCRYVYHASSDSDAYTITSDHPVPYVMGIYYFEVLMTSQGQDGFAGVGICGRSVNRNKLPGWESRSIGYHADDGSLYMGSGFSPDNLGSGYHAGDAVGVLMNNCEGYVQFTLNGAKLDKPIPVDFEQQFGGLCYPCCGARSHNVGFSFNFGRTSFLFDFDGEVQDVIRTMRREIVDCRLPLPRDPDRRTGHPLTVIERASPRPLAESRFLTHLSMSHVLYRSYPRTAEKLARRMGFDGLEDFNRREDGAGRYPGMAPSFRAMIATLPDRVVIRNQEQLDNLISLIDSGILPDYDAVLTKKLRRLKLQAQFYLLLTRGDQEAAFRFIVDHVVPEFKGDDDAVDRMAYQLAARPEARQCNMGLCVKVIVEEANRVMVQQGGGRRSVLEVALMQLILVLWSCNSPVLGSSYGVLMQMHMSGSRTFGVTQIPVDRKAK